MGNNNGRLEVLHGDLDPIADFVSWLRDDRLDDARTLLDSLTHECPIDEGFPDVTEAQVALKSAVLAYLAGAFWASLVSAVSACRLQCANLIRLKGIDDDLAPGWSERTLRELLDALVGGEGVRVEDVARAFAIEDSVEWTWIGMPPFAQGGFRNRLSRASEEFGHPVTAADLLRPLAGSAIGAAWELIVGTARAG